MANTIKLKQGSGSDPSASDLALGEPAVRTDTGEIFLKKDDGSIAKVAGGIDDGDKGDITVSNSGATFTIDNDAVTYAKIQNVSATNRILGRDSSGAGAIEEITPANLRTMLNVADGATNVTNTNQLTNGAGFITATLTNEQVQDIVGGMVSGNTESGISVTYQDGDGTLDFAVTSQTDENFTTTLKNKLDGIAASATNVTNNNQLTNGAGYITATLTNEQVQDIVGGMVTGNTESGITVTYQDGDGTLDFSVASQTDNNFTNADHSKLDGIESNATADQTASEIVALIADQTIAPSAIDMEDDEEIKLGNSDDLKIFHNGSHSRFLDNGAGKLQFGSDTGFEILTANFATQIALFDTTQILLKENTSVTGNISVSGTVDGRDIASDGSKLDGIEAGATADQSASEILTAIKTVDGASSGLDADMLDGLHAATFLRGDTADEASGDITFSGGAGAATIAANSDIRFTNGNWTGNSTKIQHHNNSLYIQGGSGATDTMALIFRSSGGTNRWIIDSSGHFHPHVDSTYDIGTSSKRIRIGYFDEVDSGEVRVNNGILETKAAIASSYTLTSDFNAMSVSPTINSGVTITVPSGAIFAIV